MPWSNQNGGGPRGPNVPSPWGQGSGGNGGNPQDMLKQVRDFFNGLFRGGPIGTKGVLAVLIIGLLLWLLTGFYTVQTNEVGLNMIFGRYTGKTQSGLNYNLPYPIGSVIKPTVTDRKSIDIGLQSEESLMLTGDENIVDLKFRVIWQIDPAKPEDYAFNLRNPAESVKAVAESVMRELVGRTDFQKIITAERKNIEPSAQEQIQRVLNSYKIGVQILQVQLLQVDPPPPVIAAFKDVTASQQDRQRASNEADAYAKKVVPEARGKASRIVQEAEGYKVQTVAEATGQVARFNQVFEQYKKAPDVTRQRLYLETMERVLGNSDKILLDKSGSGVLPYLPLGDLGKGAAK